MDQHSSCSSWEWPKSRCGGAVPVAEFVRILPSPSISIWNHNQLTSGNPSSQTGDIRAETVTHRFFSAVDRLVHVPWPDSGHLAFFISFAFAAIRSVAPAASMSIPATLAPLDPCPTDPLILTGVVHQSLQSSLFGSD